MAQVRSADKLGLNDNTQMCKIMMSRSLDHSDDADSCADTTRGRGMLSDCLVMCSRSDQHGTTSSSYSTYNTPRRHPLRTNNDARPFRREFRPNRSALPPFSNSSDRFVCLHIDSSLFLATIYVYKFLLFHTLGIEF